MPQDLIDICNDIPKQKKEAGEPIFYQGEIPRCAYILATGVVKVYDIGSSGDEKIINFFSAGDLLPPAWIFKKAPVSLFYYDAFSECTFYRVDRDKLLSAVENSTEITSYMFKHYAKSFIGSLLELNALEQSKGSEKIIHMFQYLLMRFPGEKKRDWQKIDLRITHQDLASMTGLTRETASTELNKLRRAGLLEYTSQHYSINLTQLRSSLSSEEFLRFNY